MATASPEIEFKPYNKECFDKLFQRFQYMFEPELIDEMCHYGIIRKFDADFTIMDIGQSITHMPLVINGSIKVMTEDKDGKELLLYYLELGDTCAVTLNCCSRKTKSTIRAITDSPSELIMIPVERMEKWMVKFQSWRNFVLESYNTRMNEMLEAIDNLAFNNMEERLYKYLSDKVMITKDHTLNISHNKIANDLNSSRVVISRLMKKLEIDGKIIQHRNKIEVLEYKD